MTFHGLAPIIALLLGPVVGYFVYKLIRNRAGGPLGFAPLRSDPLRRRIPTCWRCHRPIPPKRRKRASMVGYLGGGFAKSSNRVCVHPIDPTLLLTLLLVPLGLFFLSHSHPEESWSSGSQPLLLMLLLYPLAVIDWIEMEVEIRIVALGILIRMGFLYVYQSEDLWRMIAGMLIGAGFFHMVEVFYEVIRNRQGLGEGDAAVAGLIGAFIGWEGLLPMVALSAVSGLTFGIPWLIWKRGDYGTPIPFVPFLSLGGAIVFLAQLHGVSIHLWSALR